MFDPIVSESFSEKEKAILQFWKKNNIFKQSLEKRKNSPYFTIYDGPPFATGLPHYGHLLAGTIKDVVPRYMTMKGYFVPRRFGWDCHGLPVENEIEKKFQLSGRPSIEAFGMARFNEACREIVLRYAKEWQNTVERMGRWVDFQEDYHTMDLSFMESVWWVFKQLWEKGLIYEGFKVMPFSAKLGTPLSNFEANDNYKEVDDPSITVALKLEGEENTSLLIWTTTPWTLISNLALIVSPEITYVKVWDKKKEQFFILAKNRLSHYFSDPASYEVKDYLEGKQLVGKTYFPIFDYFKEHKNKGAFRVLMDTFVSTEDGTGIVHAAPAFGEIDFFICQRENIELVCPVDDNGKFTQEIPEYYQVFVKDADKDIIHRLKEKKILFDRSTIRHRYPFCWRSDTPLIYKALSSWFVHVETIKDSLVLANQEIHWTPEHIKNGRFGMWLEGARDWCISRNRYWGTPIPIWRAEDGSTLVMGSVQELEHYTSSKITDLHRHFIDNLVIEKEGKTYRRIPEVFDCWFESGSMPYAENHYPFEHADLFQKRFPANFIAEGLDQTRGWFYTLHVLSVALFNRPAFKNVVVNGILLAEDGNKMSKRLKNYPEPDQVIEKYGADATRLYLLASPAVRADDLRFSERGVDLVLKQIILPLFNSYSFFITYARICSWSPSHFIPKSDQVIDRWIEAKLHHLIQRVDEAMQDYDLSKAVLPFVDFIEQLTNWYIRRSRRRFWQEEATKDRDQAFSTLYDVLKELIKIAAPFTPFIAEDIYLNMRQPHDPISVHLCDFPTYLPEKRDDLLEEVIDSVQKVVALGHALRKEQKIKVRQPLLSMYIACHDVALVQEMEKQKHLIEEELNVKKAFFVLEEKQLVHFKVVPNYQRLGKIAGKRMPQLKVAIEHFSSQVIEDLQQGKQVVVSIEDTSFSLTQEEVEIRREVKEGLVASNEGIFTVALNTELTEELIFEGIARDIVNKVNKLRKDLNFEVTDRIRVFIEANASTWKAIKAYEQFICKEILALSISADIGSKKAVPIEVGDTFIQVAIEKNG